MRRLSVCASIIALFFLSCGKDDIASGDGSVYLDELEANSEDDNVDEVDFVRTIGIQWSSSGASVTGDEKGIVKVSGSFVTADNRGSGEKVIYELSGSSSDGYFKVYSDNKQEIVLNSLSLTNTRGAAINNQGKKSCFVAVNGTNILGDGSTYSLTPSDEDEKAVFFSEGQLIFSGEGSLTVNATGKSGIVSDDYLRVMGNPSISVTAGSSAGHGIRGKEYVQISGGTISVSTSAPMKKGIGSDVFVLVEGGTVDINVSGGVGYEDNEYKGTAGIRADNFFAMTGGTVTIRNTGTGGKGVSAGSYDFDSVNHTVSDSYISGGTLNITTSGSESNDVSSKGIKIGWVTKNGSGDRATVTGNAGNLIISGGSVTVSSSKSEAIEAKGSLTISGGSVYAYSTGDDAINSQGEMNITGGYVFAHSTQNDGIDSNKNLNLSGGYVFAITTKGSPEVALDACEGYTLSIKKGAVLVSYGGLERGYSAEQSIYSMSCTAGSWNALYDGSSYLAAFKAPSGVSSLVVSAPSLSKGFKGVSVNGNALCNGIWAVEGVSGGTEVSLSGYSGGSGGGPGGGGPGGGGRPW